MPLDNREERSGLMHAQDIRIQLGTIFLGSFPHEICDIAGQVNDSWCSGQACGDLLLMM